MFRRSIPVAALVAAVVAVAACGGSADCPAGSGSCVEPDPDAHDAHDAPGDSSLIIRPDLPEGMQGCPVGQKATWIIIQEQPEHLGAIQCAPIGSVGLGDPCTWGPVGWTTGYDDCRGGLVCSEGVCRDICLGHLGGPDDCATGTTCTVDPALFANGLDDAAYGVCL